MRSSLVLLLAGGCGVGPQESTDTDRPGPTHLSEDTDPPDDTDPPADTDTPETDTDTPETDTGDTGTAAAASAFADCVGTRNDNLGVETTYAYDSDGRLSWWEYDGNGDGVPEDRGDYTYVLTGAVVSEMTYSTLSGASGTFTNDSHGHVDLAITSSGAGTVTTTYVNTHAGALRTRSVATTLGSDATVGVDYDTCERWTRQEVDVFGDGATVVVSSIVYTTGPDCRIDAYVLTSGTTVISVSYTFDADGRIATETTSGPSPGSASWSWSCPAG